MIDIQAVTNAIVARLQDTSVPQTLTLLAQLHGATVHARTLEKAKPATPFLAYRGGGGFQRQRIIDVATFRIIVYDDPTIGYYRINMIVPLVSEALLADPRLSVDTGLLGEQSHSWSSETVDGALNLLMRYMTLSIETSGR